MRLLHVNKFWIHSSESAFVCTIVISIWELKLYYGFVIVYSGIAFATLDDSSHDSSLRNGLVLAVEKHFFRIP